MVPWSPVKEIGGRNCRIAFPNSRFWDLWRSDRPGVERLGITLEQDPKTNAWVAYWWNQQEAAPVQKEAPKAAELDESVLPESLRAKVRSYQVQPTLQTIRALSRPPHRFFNGSDMGTGKTFVSLASAMAMGKKVLAVVRISAFSAWKEVAHKHFGFKPGEFEVINRDKLRTGKTQWIKKETIREIGGKERKIWKWQLPPNTILIYDEVHNDAAPDSINAEMLIAACRQKIPIIAMSATGGEDPSKMRAIGYLLGLHNDTDDTPELRNFYAWMFHNGCQKGESGFTFNFGQSRQALLTNAIIREDVERKRIEVMNKIHADITNRGMFTRVRKIDIPGFPKSELVPLPVDFGEEEIAEIYREMNRELEELRARSRGLSEGDRKGSAREIMIRARQRTELIKIPWLVEDAKQTIDEGGSIAVFLNFRESVKAFAARMKTKCIFEGDMSMAERDQNLKRFQADEERCIVLNSQAGGESIGLHDLRGKYWRKAQIMPTFWLTLFLQCTGRVWRDGAKSLSQQVFPFAIGTIEEQAYNAIVRKKKQADAFNGDLSQMLTAEDFLQGVNL